MPLPKPSPRKQPWMDFTHAEYNLKDAETITFAKCVQYSGGLASLAFANGKIEVITYGDYSGVEPCPFVTLEQRWDNTVDHVISVGKNVDRALDGITRGLYFMVYAAGTSRPHQGMAIAPHPLGFQEWKPGMFKLGKLIAEVGSAGIDFSTLDSDRVLRVAIDLIKEPQTIIQNATVTTHIGTLLHPIDEPIQIIATTETATDYHVKIEDLAGIIGTVAAGGYITYQTRRETCQAGGTVTTVVLDASASAVDDTYNGMFIEVYKPDGSFYEKVVISDYVGSTTTVTVTPALSAAPDTGYNFHIIDPDAVYSIEFNATDAVTAARLRYKTTEW